MNNLRSSNGSDVVNSAFVSGVALKTAHSELLSRYRKSLGAYSFLEKDSPELHALLPEITKFIARGRLTGKLIDSEEERAASQAYLDYWVSVIYRSSVDRDEKSHDAATLADFDEALAPEIPESLCPYLGLDPFQEQNKTVFYGRRSFVDEMVAKIRTERLLAVVGPSGSGKSSAVMAGLLPALRAGACKGSENWNYFRSMVPTANPLQSLALAVMPQAERGSRWVHDQVESLKSNPQHLSRLLAQISEAPSVLVVDQFEEVFTLCNDTALVDAFVRNLLAAATSESGHRIIITMRIEFQVQMPVLDAIYPLFLKGLVQVLPLSVVDLREAIEKPAAEVGLKFEEGVVDALVREIVGEPAGLPLLQFALWQLWRRRRRNRVLLDDYNKLGGARKALTNVASEVFLRLPIQDQTVAKRIFLRLAWAGDGVEVLRNRVLRRHLHKIGGSSDQVDSVLGKLVAARLVRLTRDEFAEGSAESADDQFDVAHEALIRNWQMLIDWLQAEQENLRQRTRIRSAAELWRAHGKDPGGLLGGSLLADASKHTDLDDLEKEFIEASLEAEAQARRKEVAHYQALAAEKSRAARRLQYLVGGLVIGLVLTVSIALYAMVQRNQANASKMVALVRKNAAEEAELAAKENQEKAVASELRARQEEMEAEKLRAVAQQQLQVEQALRQEAQVQTAAARESERLAKIAQTEAIEQRQRAEMTAAELNKAKREVEVAADEAQKSAAEALKNANDARESEARAREETDKSTRALYAATTNIAQLTADLRSKESESARLQKLLATEATFSPDSSKLLTLSLGEAARLWDLKKGQIIISEPQATSAALSVDGKLFATTNAAGDLTLRFTESDKLRRFPKLVSNPRKVVFSADSQKLAVLGSTSVIPGEQINIAKVIDVKAGNTIDLHSPTSDAINIAFSPDGQSIAFTDLNGQTVVTKFVRNQQSISSALGTSGCRAVSLNLLTFSPSEDLRATIHLETLCDANSTADSKVVATAKAGLSSEQAAVALGPASSKAVNLPPTAAPATAPRPVRTVAVAPTATYLKPSLAQIDFSLKRRERSGDFIEIGRFQVSTTSVGTEIAKLVQRGLSQEDLRDISSSIIAFANDYAGLDNGAEDPSKTAKSIQLVQNLARQISGQLHLSIQ